MSDDVAPEMFDRDYVQNLRQEAKTYRLQVRDLESKVAEYASLEASIAQVRVENELIRRGVHADPSWIKMQDGQQVSEAIDTFLEQYPELVAQAAKEVATKPTVKGPKAINNNSPNTGTPGPDPKGTLTDRALNEIKEDPQARKGLQDLYRSLLQSNSGENA